MPSTPSTTAQNAASRAAIRAADPVLFLISVMQGEKIPERDERGRITNYLPPAEVGQRIAVAQSLAKKVLPDLSAQQIDVGSSDGSIRIVFGDGMVPPGSVDDDARDTIDITPEQPETPALESHEAVPVPPEAETPEPAPEPAAERPKRTRRRWRPEDPS